MNAAREKSNRSRRRSAFKQRDVTRALKATKAAGIEVARVEIENDGKIVVVTRTPGAATDDMKEIVL